MILRLALRNLGRATWRTTLAGTALALATALLVVTLALVEGLFAGMVRGATRRGDGDALIVRRAVPGDTRQLLIADADTLSSELRRLPAVSGASPRLRIQGVLLAGDRRAAAEIVGIDPAAEAGVTDLQRLIFEGGPLPAAGGSGVLLARLLAQRLAVRTGDSLTLVTRAADGLPAVERFIVAGIFATGDPRRDGLLALAGRTRIGALAGVPGMAHEIGLALERPADSLREAAAITGELPPGSGLAAVPWQARSPALAAAVRFSRASSWWLIALFHTVAGIVTLIVLLLGAHERRREHAVCLALGAPASLLRRVIAAEALTLGAGAVVAGAALGAAIAFPLLTRGLDISRLIGPVGYAGGTILPVLHTVLRADDLLRTGLTLIGVCALAGWISGRRIASLAPAAVLAGRDAA